MFIEQNILYSLAQAVIEMDVTAARRAADEAIQNKIDPYKAIMDGLSLWIR
ncbi:MAG: hypothetical protein HY578_05885 [Nitrospinae bacterium]|nr:hypothetical protein [Nitrospinota bacterium]